MVDLLLFAVFPYVAILTLIIGTIYRFRNGVGISSLSSQFLEREKILWGSYPWHIGIIVILLAHLFSFLVPKFFIGLSEGMLMLIEGVGLAFSFLTIFGMLVLLYRRLLDSKIRKTTSKMDWAIFIILILQVLIGTSIALFFRWGSTWSAQTTTPYMWGILTFQVNVNYIGDMPIIIKAHVFLAWLFVFILPFSRLIHVLTVPLQYFFRKSPQKVVFNYKREV